MNRLSQRLRAAAIYVKHRKKRFLALLLTGAHILGALTSVQAIMTTRTSQGATAWAVSLNTFPYVAVPAYWIFGRSKFEGYEIKRRGNEEKSSPLIAGLTDFARRNAVLAPSQGREENRLIERLTRLPATTATTCNCFATAARFSHRSSKASPRRSNTSWCNFTPSAMTISGGNCSSTSSMPPAAG